jgi:hypothetical protein
MRKRTRVLDANNPDQADMDIEFMGDVWMITVQERGQQRGQELSCIILTDKQMRGIRAFIEECQGE